MFVGDFDSKLETFGSAKKDSSGPTLKNIQSLLNLTYSNNDEHTHLDKAKGSTDVLNMAFTSPNLTKHDNQYPVSIVKLLKRGKTQGLTTNCTQ